MKTHEIRNITPAFDIGRYHQSYINQEEVPERTVVPMDEFEHLRKNRYTHGGAGTLVYISGEGEANQN